MMPPTPSLTALSISQLAQRTGVSAGTLRMWEARHGFPEPRREGGGHRRYDERDVELVRSVLRLRDQGLSLSAAIARAQLGDSRQPASIYRGLRERCPDLLPVVVSKRALLIMTHAIEDEHLARAGSPILLGSFQRVRFYLQSRQRWAELARTARIAVTLADFEGVRDEQGQPCEVPIERHDPLAREWAIVVRGHDSSACLAGWEMPLARPAPDLQRRFEVVWSIEPEAADTAAAIATQLIAAPAPAIAARLRGALEDVAAPSAAAPGSVSALAHRMISYLATDLDGAKPL